MNHLIDERWVTLKELARLKGVSIHKVKAVIREEDIKMKVEVTGKRVKKLYLLKPPFQLEIQLDLQ